MTDDHLPTRTEGEGETLDMPEGMGTFASGQVLGERYQILEMLGRGGMGEVWKAFDLKLRVEVALKALRPEFFKSERRLELLRQEVRAAREVVSPNVCRIFDLIEVEGRELVSMEYVDGATLLGVLQERGPLDLKEAQDIASQFLAGLEAIHKVGLVHRDIKPENIMLTRAGRVVVMDFGLAREETEGGGSVSGTPAYMAPEQAAGQTLDARADVYAAGVVLAEMVSPDGIKSYESRQSLWEGVRSEPAKLPDSPWAPVIQQAVKKDRERRYNTAHTLTRALEDVTLRVEGADDLHPYPGLASFTEEDAEYFFGREAEVEQMWRKLEGSPRLLGLVGPSGAGKTSFLSAGLLPSAPSTWVVVRCKPGTSPFVSLGQALAPEIARDADAMHLLPRVQEPDVAVELVQRWSRTAPNAVLIVDQFEELFTLNADDMQDRFSTFLSRLPLEADIFVLLSLRDDFLMQCNRFERLQPIVHGLTLLDPPAGPNLRRALVQPAMKCGYRFEDDDLVDEMLEEVEGERGALPLLAFAAARLWEMRDRETGLLTRQAYLDIGGVGGALARHAEATIDRIGTDDIAVVREVFRNLVTAEGTRAVREWDELLSVFPEDQKETAGRILRELVDARLLTSYEIREDENEPIRRVEIIHESLLANWPRLVRWQTQDADAAQLRDQLRQAAKTWDEQGRSDDTLWTGAAYREFALWRERYPGGLTKLEEAFAKAMTTLAGRRRRHRRVAVASILVIAAIVVAVTTTLWRRSVLQQLRADAATLLSQAQVELEPYPSAAVAYATASLELSDNLDVRLLALEALWKGPPAFVVNEDRTYGTAFTPDGRWLVQPLDGSPNIRVIAADGKTDLLEQIDAEDTSRIIVTMDRKSDIFLSRGFGGERISIGLWSASERSLLAKHFYDADASLRGLATVSSQQRALVVVKEDSEYHVDVLRFDGSHERLGAVSLDSETTDTGAMKLRTNGAVDGRIWATKGHDVFVIDVGEHELSGPRRVFRQKSSIDGFSIDPLGRFLATADEEGTIRLWYTSGPSRPQILRAPAGVPFRRVGFTRDGSLLFTITTSESDTEVVWLWTIAEDGPRFLRSLDVGKEELSLIRVDPSGLRVARGRQNPRTPVWSLNSPADAEPLVLAQAETNVRFSLNFSPDGRWFASAADNGLVMWPLAGPHPTVIRRHGERVGGLAFGLDGRWLASASWDGTVKLWPLAGDPPPPGRVLVDKHGLLSKLVATRNGERLLVGSEETGVWMMNPDTGDSHIAPVFEDGAVEVAVSPDGHLAAAVGGQWGSEKGVIRVWELASGDEVAVLAPTEGANSYGIEFIEDNVILTANESKLRRWNLETGETDVVYEGPTFSFVVSGDGRRLVVVELVNRSPTKFRASFVDLATGSVIPLTTHGDYAFPVALNRSGSMVVTGDTNGIIRVGHATGGKPHLLLGHEGPISALAIDPQDRWIASGGHDGTVRLWPMPDLSKPPLHTLPREELIAKLKTLTNLRVARDPESATGWKLTHDPFPGWEEVPTW